ncbi:MAG: hypothetical protein VKL59_01890 [Nostocaceae cyanobacterium]|nr:hypothetical protein [Nostocaceae cyanobacterium]
MLNKIALRRLRCWLNHSSQQDPIQAKVLGLELGQLGFKINNIEVFTSTTREEFETALSILEEMRGGNVKYVPLFTGFPDDLPNDGEYLIRRVLAFFFGLNSFTDSCKFGADPVTQMQREDLWKAAVEEQTRRLTDTHTEWITLTLVSQNEAEQKLTQWVSNLVYGATPIKEALWDDIIVVLDQLNVEIKTENIRIKETLARLAANQWQKWGKIIVRTPTDLLRMFAFIQGQDVSLAQPVDLKGLKLSKPQRREIITFLNNCPALSEDLLRYKRLWISLSKWLHPGDFVKQFPGVPKAFDDLRNDRIKSFESLVINSPVQERIENLLERPSLLLRKLTWLLKDCRPEMLADSILRLKDNVSTLPLPLLATAYYAVKYDGDRVVINKKGKPHTITKRESLGDVSAVLEAIDTLILTKLRGSKDWDKVWIDPAIDKLVLPLQARKQSDGLLNLARGSRIALNNEVVRLFVYWQESTYRTDLDLSAMQLDTNFNFVGHVGWNNYGSGNDIAHSGDIQSAPIGAAEFIDLRLAALEDGYILPSIIRFTGEKFSELKAGYAGWMNRHQVGSDTQTFDAKTVAEKVDVHQDGKIWIPFLLDISAKEIVYVDIYSKGWCVIEQNEHFPALAARLASYWQAKPTFGALARWYARTNNAILVQGERSTITIGISDDCTINVLKLVGEGVTSF